MLIYAGNCIWKKRQWQAAGDAASSTEVDSKGESDNGAFDTVTRATANHGLHRGSFQCNAVIKAENGKEYNVSYWEADGKTAVLTDGSFSFFAKAVGTESGIKDQALKTAEEAGFTVTPAATVDTAALETSVSESETLKESDYTAESWATYQAALQSTRAGAGLGGEFWKRKKRK